jgi:cyclophilin family peptidyl-prolyl cis-trans isomerase
MRGTAMRAKAASLLVAAALVCLPVLFWAGSVEGQTRMLRVLIETELGNIEVEVDAVHAPITTANFLKYVDGGLYNGGQFHRTVKPFNQPDNKVKIEVVQAGINPTRKNEGFPAIPLERTSVTGLSHKHGTISMARGNPDSAASDFFICIGDQPRWTLVESAIRMARASRPSARCPKEWMSSSRFKPLPPRSRN